MAILMNITLALNIISALSLIGLIYVYYNNLMKIKSKFTVGLMIFAASFLLQNFVALYFHITMMEFYTAKYEVYECFFTIIQTAAFLILLIITWE